MDIQYLLVLQGIREALSPACGAFFMFVSNLVHGAALVMVPCIVYWCFDRRRGLVMLFSFALGTLTNQLVKCVACVPRPWIRDTRIHPYEDALDTATGFSFPSGHSQGAASVLGALGWTYRKESRAVVWTCAVVVLVLALSRNMLGVHTPQDVVAGLAVGALSVFAAERILDWTDGADGRDVVVAGTLMALSVAFLVFVTFKSYPEKILDLAGGAHDMHSDNYEACGFALGAALSWLFERRHVTFEPASSRRQKALRIAIGAIAVVLARYGLTALLSAALPLSELAVDFLKGFLAVIAAVCVAPVTFVWAERRLGL